ncbi:MAG: apolipoprotein N-acyltransferase [Lachnospiraceae bacterium]|nr:apolipoprotein N-acyltransferase [Lachnospiraceae bacterium]
MSSERIRFSRKKILKPGALWAVISGAVTAAAAMYSQLAWLAWISLIPYFITLYQYTDPENGKRHLFRTGFLFGYGYCVPLASFLYALYPMDVAGIGPLGSVFIILLGQFGATIFYSLPHGLLPCVLRLLRKRRAWERRSMMHPLSIAALWVLAEWCQSQTWLGMPWARLAAIQYRLTPLIQSASLLGSYFVSFIMVLFNALLALFLYSCFFSEDTASGKRGKLSFIARSVPRESVHERRDVRKVCPLLCAAVLFAGNLIYGLAALNTEHESSETISVAIIQGNVSSSEKWEGNSNLLLLEHYLSMTKEASGDEETDLIVWTEGCLPFYLNKYAEPNLMIQNAAMETGAVILVGALYQDESDDVYNAVYAFYPDGTVSSQPYFKRKLVPFGEYMPLEDFLKSVLPVLNEINLLGSSLTPGTDSNLLSTDFGMIGGLVCFDSLYEEPAFSSVRDGAELLALLSNDTWFDNSYGVYKLLAHSVLRAVENGRCIVRGANTGISAVIDANGRITEESQPQEEEVIRGEAEIYSCRTLYSYVGNIWLLFCLLYVLVLLIPFKRPKKGGA